MPTTATGPSRNALRHGLAAAQVIIPGESQAEYEELRQYLVDAHQPAEGLESILVDQISQCLWRLNRARRLEREALEQELIAPEGATSNRAEKITRYMTAIEREFHRAVRELTNLQANRIRKSDSVPKTAARERAANTDNAIRDYIFAPIPQPKTEITKQTPAPTPPKPTLRSQMPENLALCL